MSANDWNEQSGPQELPGIAGPWDGERYVMYPHERTAVPTSWETGYYEVMTRRDGFALVWQRGPFASDYASKQARP